MRRTVVKGRRPDGMVAEVVRLEPETPEDVEEIQRLERAGLVDTDEGPGDEEVRGQKEA